MQPTKHAAGGEHIMKKQKKQKQGVVLLIEDEEDTADLIKLHLEQTGCLSFRREMAGRPYP
jgi:hypothetical protein